MIQKIKAALLSLGTVFILAISMAPSLAYAQSPTSTGANIQGNLCQGADSLSTTTNSGASCSGLGTTGCDFDCIVRKVVNLLSVIVGIVAVIMIIVGGLRYVTSGGKQESVTGAKNTILYAIIGLVIVALAQVVVRFVLTKTTSS